MTTSWLVKCSHRAEKKILTDLLEWQELSEFNGRFCMYLLF